jgi:hypothetical protein
MNMKEHILMALTEQFDNWEKLLVSLAEEKVIAPHFDFDWSIKDVMAHLWAWQQISIARMKGGLYNHEPMFPKWIVEAIDDWEEDADGVNALTYETQHNKPWSEIHQTWRNGFLRLLELGDEISERDLLNGDRYPWLKGYSLAFILVASYDHHQEHFEKLTNWIQKNNN